MIFYASQRGNADELAKHLLNAKENEHVTVHEVRGFVADDLAGALMEAYAISKGASCKHFLFSVSLNPPEYADVPIEDFEAAIEEIEKKLGLLEQPRIVVFHEKHGRRHCHAVWLRLRPSTHTNRLIGINLPHFKFKLMDISRGLFLKYGWKMPKGMERKGRGSDPFKIGKPEYLQAIRLAEDPIALKVLFKRSWETTDSKQTFARFLSENGFFLAQGERRGYVAVDLAGKVYSLSKWIDIPTRELKARLGPPESLPTIEKARVFIAERMTANLKQHMEQLKAEAKQKRLPLVQEIRSMTAHHRKDRADLIYRQEQRHREETKVRVAQFAKGVAALWERATGEYKRKCVLNVAEIKACRDRDRKELQTLIRSQLVERQGLEKTVRFYREEHRIEVSRLRQEIARYVGTATEPPQPAARAAAGKLPLAAQLARIEGKISLLPAEFLRREIAKYTPAATETPPLPVVKSASIAKVVKPLPTAPSSQGEGKISLPPADTMPKIGRSIPPAVTGTSPEIEKSGSPSTLEKAPLAAQLAQVEIKLALLSGDMTQLQASLESNLISDEMRGRIRRLIEKTLQVLQLKELEITTEEKKARDKTREYQVKQAEFYEYVRQYAAIQLRIEAEKRQQEANQQFYSLISNMSYSLNGLPQWHISVMMPPPEKKLDEREYVQKVVLQRDTAQLVQRVLYSPENESLVSKRPPIDPRTAVPALRRNILEVKEMMARAGLRPPSGGGTSGVSPAVIRMTAAPATATIKFNQKR